MTTGRRLGLSAASLLLLLTACGPAEPSDEARADVSPSPSPTTASPPTTVPPGACTIEVSAAEPVEQDEQDAAAPSTDDGTGDMPPNHADNRGWRQRSDLTAQQIATATDLAEQVRGVLHPLCEQGQFTPAVVREALQEVVGPSAVVMGFESASGETSTGLVIAVDVPGGGCVTGSSSPGAVHLRVDGPTGEGTCLEPVSH